MVVSFLLLYSNVLNGFAVQEKLILRKLKFRLNTPTPYVFMVRFLKAAQSDKKVCNSACIINRHVLTTIYQFSMPNYCF